MNTQDLMRLVTEFITKSLPEKGRCISISFDLKIHCDYFGNPERVTGKLSGYNTTNND